MSTQLDQMEPGGRRVQFNVLGPLTVVDGPSQLNIGGVKQRSVLALLVAGAGHPVSNDAIAEAVYADDTGGRGRRRIQTYVSNLRSVVGDAISRDGGGWALRVGREQIDALRFEDLYESVRAAPDMTPEQAARSLREALSLWRGRPYHDVEVHGHLDGEVTRLVELRVAAQAARIDADLASGRHRDLVGEIEALMAEHPYLEQLRAQHMLALYRAGRQREALRSYEQMRTLLVEELGVDPTAELQDLERRILDQDEGLQPASARQIQKRAVLVVDPGDPIDLARLAVDDREARLAETTRLLERVLGNLSSVTLPAGAASFVVFDSMT